jgi:hypothetical protein
LVGLWSFTSTVQFVFLSHAALLLFHVLRRKREKATGS